MTVTQSMINEIDARLEASIADFGAMALAVKAQRDEAMAVLRELVAVDALRIRLIGFKNAQVRYPDYPAYLSEREDYEKRRPLAWAAAIALVAKESKS